MDANGSEETRSTENGGLRRFLPRAPKTGTLLRAGLSTFVVLAMGMLLMHSLGLFTIPSFITTTGKIYVDSPEVYTRERLVNDRYDEDYWLRQQLKMLDERENLRLVTAREAISADVGVGGAEAAGAANELGAGDQVDRLSFEQEFRIVSGIRDAIRQQILENMLDDRHDLTSNSVYGLKFDTTVIPGTNTQRRAFVHVELPIDPLFDRTTATEGGVPYYVLDYCDRKKGVVTELNSRQKQYYDDWLKDLQKRLNRMEDSVFRAVEERKGADEKDQHERSDRSEYDICTALTLEAVLGIPAEVFYDFNRSPPQRETKIEYSTLWINILRIPPEDFYNLSRCPLVVPDEGPSVLDERGSIAEDLALEKLTLLEVALGLVDLVSEDSSTEPSEAAVQAAKPLKDWIRLPDPWANYFLIGRRPSGQSENASRPFGVMFEVVELFEGFEVRKSDAPIEEGLLPIGDSEDGVWKLFVDGFLQENRERFFADAFSLKYAPGSAAIVELLSLKKELCDRDNLDDCKRYLEGGEIEVPSGLFNFIEDLGQQDAYSYAMFPKNDVTGILWETSALLAAEASGGFLGLEKQSRRAATSSVLVGYGDGSGGGPHTRDREPSEGGAQPSDRDADPAHRRPVAFGWVISPQGNMEPAQKSLLALVSVPAWTSTLHLDVSVGWLDQHGDSVADQEEGFPVDISVPPDYETFDSVFRNDPSVSRNPRIQEDEMDKDIYVRAGGSTKILIPGSRLWRSATVTLGAEIADRIRVMPNMQGVVAEFDEVDLPYAAYNPDSGVTSEEAEKDSPVGTSKVTSEECEHIEGLRGRPVQLRVWTSEGVARAVRPVCVMYDREQVTGEKDKTRSPVAATPKHPRYQSVAVESGDVVERVTVWRAQSDGDEKTERSSAKGEAD